MKSWQNGYQCSLFKFAEKWEAQIQKRQHVKPIKSLTNADCIVEGNISED